MSKTPDPKLSRRVRPTTARPSRGDRVPVAPDRAAIAMSQGPPAELLALELALARRDFAALPDGVDGILDDGFLEIGASGLRWSREATLTALRGVGRADVSIEEFAAELLAEDVVLTTYVSRLNSGSRVRRMSLWIRRDGRWRIRFHQGTAARE